MSEEDYIRVLNFTDCFHICVTRAQNYRGAEDDPSSRWLGLTFDGADKEALFFRALNAFDPAGHVRGRIPAEDYHRGKWKKELWMESKRSIEEVTANLPMLRRLKEEYNDAVFSPEEVAAFREECLAIRARTDNPEAISALETLLRACEEAIREDSGLFFASN